MFGFFDKNSANQEQRIAEKQQAYELGERFADDTSQIVKDYIDHRLPAVRKNYMAVLRSQLDNIFESNDVDPRAMARMHVTLFFEELESLPQKLATEIAEAYPDVAELIGELNRPDTPITLEYLVKIRLDADLADMFKYALTMSSDEIALVNQGMRHGPDTFQGSEALAAVTMRLMAGDTPPV